MRAAWTIPLLLLSLVGCDGGSPCRTVCAYNVDCTIEQLDDRGLECAWDDPDDAFDACMSICDHEWDRMDDEDRGRVADCIACVEHDLDGSCDADDYADAFWDDCDDWCDEREVYDFYAEFGEDWVDEFDDLECDD